MSKKEGGRGDRRGKSMSKKGRKYLP